MDRDEKLDKILENQEQIKKRIRHIEISGDIQTAINIIVFLGIASIGILVSKVKSKI